SDLRKFRRPSHTVAPGQPQRSRHRDRGSPRAASTGRADRSMTEGEPPMTEQVRAEANAVLKEVEAVTANLLPEPKAELATIDAADPALRAEIEKRKAEIDMTNSQSIIRFGSAAQGELQTISQEMLADVRNKDVGPAGDSLRDMVSSLRGFSVTELDPNRKQSWWERLLGRTKPIAQFMARYEDVQDQIDN